MQQRPPQNLTLAVNTGVRTGSSILLHTLAVGAGTVWKPHTTATQVYVTKHLMVLGASERSHRDSGQ